MYQLGFFFVPFVCVAFSAICSSSQFRCNNLQCIDAARKCDGVSDCLDRSDEINCGEFGIKGF